MPLLTKTDLQFKYSWTALSPDDPKHTGKPDSTELNRKEGYEVLPFINAFAEKNNWKQKASGLKLERMIHEHLPSNVRSHAKVKEWVTANWKNYV
jgi:hypothetical protein